MRRAKSERFPPQIKFLAWNEGCERFSFYGMSSILTIYMATHLAMPESDAEADYHLFVSAVYVTPLLGAWLADRFFGRYALILWLSLGYVLGHATVAAFDGPSGLLAGLALIAAGAGGIKPCAAAFVGDQFTRENQHLLTKVYDLYYWMINLGAMAATLLIPEILARSGPRLAFALPGALMALALAIFWCGSRSYIVQPPSGPSPHGFFRVTGHALSRLGTGRRGDHWLQAARDRHPEEAVEAAKAVFRIAGVFASILTFWALFFQYGSSWVLQAERMDRDLLGYEIKASQMSTLDALFVLVTIPVLAGWLYPWLERRGLGVTALGKMTAGMFVTVLSFVAAGLVQRSLDAGAVPHVAWQVPQYLFLALGEVLVSVTALEFAYTQAPRSMKSVIMSLWYLTIALGSLLTAAVAKLNRFHGTAYFAFFAVLMLLGAVAFAWVARRYRPVEFRAAPAQPAPDRGAA
jgi:proton-dependent oligopeptide transporter, POT family